MSKQLPWFRVYTRMVDDDKLKLLAFEDRWHFVALLCLKGEGLLDKGDTPGLLMRKIAVKMGLDVRTLEEVARRLAEVGLVDQATLQPTKWNGLQMRSDSDPTAAERKRHQREREKAEREDAAAAAAAAGVTGGHEAITDASRVTGTNVTRTDIDTDTELKEEAKASLSTAALPDCPHAEIIELFGDKLPELPQPRTELWGGQRAKALKARWRWCLTASRKDGRRYATNRDEALQWFGKFFAYIRRCPHLMGDNTRGWTPDLGWLVKEENFTKVQQGNYEVKTGEGA